MSDEGTTAIQRRLRVVQARLAAACARARRAPAEVRLVAVTKYVDLDAIRALLACGVRDLGENQVQQLTRRAQELGATCCGLNFPTSGQLMSDATPPCWHMIGHLQRNKVRSLLACCRVIHSVDSLRLAKEIDTQAAAQDALVDVLMEINIAGEANKHGLSPAEAPVTLEAVRELKRLRVRGLMTMAPLNPDAEAARPHFAALRELGERWRQTGLLPTDAQELSMGMTQDFEPAIEEGATLIRVGSALFHDTD